jgi:hypothetical protein
MRSALDLPRFDPGGLGLDVQSLASGHDCPITDLTVHDLLVNIEADWHLWGPETAHSFVFCS